MSCKERLETRLHDLAGSVELLPAPWEKPAPGNCLSRMRTCGVYLNQAVTLLWYGIWDEEVASITGTLISEDQECQWWPFSLSTLFPSKAVMWMNVYSIWFCCSLPPCFCHFLHSLYLAFTWFCIQFATAEMSFFGCLVDTATTPKNCVWKQNDIFIICTIPRCIHPNGGNWVI